MGKKFVTMGLGAVITADIVNSTKLSRPSSKKLVKKLESLFAPYQYEFYRGDSFQVYLRTPEDALPLILQARTAAIQLDSEEPAPASDIRASIGIGPVKLPVRSLPTAGGEAFVLSGRQFDEMKPGQRLTIHCPETQKATNLGLGLMARFLDYLFLRMTSKQAFVVFELLQQRTQVETARRLKKSQATVHKHLQAAGWPEIEKMISTYRDLVATIET